MKYGREDRVFVQLQGKVIGPWPVKQLPQLKGFTLKTFISYPGSEKWAPAYRVLKTNTDLGHVPLSIGPGSNQASESRWDPFDRPFFDWCAKNTRSTQESWVDRSFRRLFFLNTFLAIGIYAVWSYAPCRKPLEKELRRDSILIEHQIRPIVSRLNWRIKGGSFQPV